jgi:hypothetical protein
MSDQTSNERSQHRTNSKSESNGRDTRGRFAQGNPGGPGNPFARRVAELRSAFLKAVSPEDLRQVVLTVLKQAKEGDMASAKLLFQYCVGKPTPAPNPDCLDRDEYEVLRQRPTIGELMLDLKRPPFGAAVDLSRSLEPFQNERLAEMLRPPQAAKAGGKPKNEPGRRDKGR